MVSALTVRKHHGLILPNSKCQAVPTFSPQLNLKTQHTPSPATAVIAMGVSAHLRRARCFALAVQRLYVRRASSVLPALPSTSALAIQNCLKGKNMCHI